jgi:hypothetical protein
MPARPRTRLPLPPAAAVLVAAAALFLTGCSSGHRTSAGPSGPASTSAAPTGGASSATTPPPSSESGTASPSPSGSTAVVRITTLRSGQTITLPATIGYAVTGLHFDASSGYRLRVQLGASGSYGLDLPISSPTGTVKLPRDKMLPGKRDLTFSLTRTGVTADQLSQRVASLTDVTIYGPK